MTEQINVVAVPCSFCARPFDLRYDLARMGNELGVDEVFRLLRTKNLGQNALCWDCRAMC